MSAECSELPPDNGVCAWPLAGGNGGKMIAIPGCILRRSNYIVIVSLQSVFPPTPMWKAFSMSHALFAKGLQFIAGHSIFQHDSASCVLKINGGKLNNYSLGLFHFSSCLCNGKPIESRPIIV